MWLSGKTKAAYMSTPSSQNLLVTLAYRRMIKDRRNGGVLGFSRSSHFISWLMITLHRSLGNSLGTHGPYFEAPLVSLHLAELVGYGRAIDSVNSKRWWTKSYSSHAWCSGIAQAT